MRCYHEEPKERHEELIVDILEWPGNLPAGDTLSVSSRMDVYTKDTLHLSFGPYSTNVGYDLKLYRGWPEIEFYCEIGEERPIVSEPGEGKWHYVYIDADDSYRLRAILLKNSHVKYQTIVLYRIWWE